MTLTRRQLVMATAASVSAAAITGCRKVPAMLRRNIRAVVQTVAGIPTQDGAGVKLTRVIGQPLLRHLDPFLMLDFFHSDDANAYIQGFPDHPHRGFETVTVMRHGRMRHGDSKGNRGLVVGGGSQWMTAGRGIVHSEMPEQESGLMSGFQLWLNLPAAEKMVAYEYHDMPPEQLAQGKWNGQSEVSLIAGELEGLKGPVRPRPTQPLLLRLFLEDDRPVELPVAEGHASFVFTTEGQVDLGAEGKETTVAPGHLASLGEGSVLRVRAKHHRAEVLIAAAKPLRERIVQWGPFVMNSEEEIHRALADYRAGVLDA